MGDDGSEIVEFLNRTGVLGVLILNVVGLLRGWVVPRREYEAMREERDEWKRLALASTDTTQRATRVAEARAR